MSKKILDCKGLACPMPVIMTKKELEQESVEAVEVTVDNLTAKENLLKLGKSLGIEGRVSQKQGNYTVVLEKEQNGQSLTQEGADVVAQDQSSDPVRETAEVVLITSEFLGKGDDELGKILMKGFLYTLSETMPYPKKVLFLNSAVKLTTENDEAVVNLKKLEEKGTMILSCGTCLDFYHLKDDLKVGVVANMYDIVEGLKSTTDKMIL